MKAAVICLAIGIACLQAQPKRPQTPLPPFPYRSQEVSFPSKAAGVTLSGSLTIPEGSGPYPAMILVTGSGPQDRDETLFGHKPFAVIADYLARRDVGVLRYDDRGTAKSTGRFLGATTADFALDAEGALNYLLKRPEFTKVGIGGHSEGAVIAPMVAARRRDVAFVVMLAGMGVSGEELIYAQAAATRHARGIPKEEIERNRRALEILFPLARRGASEAEMLRSVRAKLGANPDAERDAKILADPWHRAFAAYDPTPMLAKVRCPVLVMNGDLDLQVLADQNVPAITAALRKGGNQRITVRRFPNLNHLFQTATTGLPDEYPQIDETIAPLVLETVANWLHEVAQ
jgi:pimeloyl-ACP methyl ester carboxylesterase